MSSARNVLFIMCDQLRWDYLSCYGHPTIRTPNIDALARKGVRFTNAYIQSASCGPSRMSYYTGRYVSSHRAFGNFVPLPLDELTLGDYLRPHGIRVAIDGKTHVEAPDPNVLSRLRIEPQSEVGQLISQGGFEPFDRHDGVLADPHDPEALSNKYTKFLLEKGYESINPWLDYANSALGEDKVVLSGWNMRYADLPARVDEQHSETAYTTDRAMEFMTEQGDRPWCLHLSYIKPHWPYVAPDPYHHMYGPADVVPAVKSEIERADPHPLYASYLKHRASVTFSDQATREKVIPTYMGLITQIDDHLGRLFEFMEDHGRFKDTLIVFCSDHGDYLGDHHLGEKELWHDTVIKVPLIIYDPSAAADALRGKPCDAFVEAVDMVPTFLDFLGIAHAGDVIEGKSVLPLLRGVGGAPLREFIISEFDYSFRTSTRKELNRPVKNCRTLVLRDREWKFVFCEGMRPLLFDLQADPHEFCDLGGDSRYEAIVERYSQEVAVWLSLRKTKTTASDEYVENWLGLKRFQGMKIGEW
ncbi:alkaline phosphatase family protein [Paralcaligenes ureilyticus]|uniref:Arylsulfatase A-like enzyme n=1 Tax=Paralcaligenes ureilyticus TaxID=627131 RepID=A0A4R3LU03_9BURK|nr:alkaline phosphatase family protein [Paralcaligenes ureilyticus]TCT04032.1 arylsulfatase A-like enzyme [Paralcaligenes ureilyticus]